MSVPALLAEWLGAARASASEVGTTALGCSQVEDAPESPASKQRALFGAYVPLTADDYQLQVGVVAEWAACEALARALFGHEPGWAFEAESDVCDALGEIANMVAGGIKTRMNARVPGLSTGLPLCVSGQVEPRVGVEHVSLSLAFDELQVSVEILLSTGCGPLSALTRAQKSRTAEPE